MADTAKTLPFGHDPLVFAYFGTGISVLLAMFTWIMLRTRDQVLAVAEACRQNEQRWKFALEGTGDGVWDWNVQSGAVMYSKRWKEILGFAEDEIGNHLQTWESLMHTDDEACAKSDLQAYFDGKADSYINKHRLRCKDGNYKWLLHRGMATERDPQGRPLRIIGTSSDITAARQSEEARLARMAQQRDILVREVHHRIKNNLQGVAGLLRQHAAKETQLSDIINQAVTQVQAVGIVHGLQGQALYNEVVLCEMVPAIARMAETLLKPSPLFDIRIDVPQRIRVAEHETVPIALVLNELIVNAVKHAPHETPPHIGIAVCWDHEQMLARIRIVNVGTLPPEFDFNSGKGCGTGLDLARSLLPHDGVRLSFSECDSRVCVTLELFAPSIYNLQEAHFTQSKES
ncbi:MAG: PAS domain-containing protein [Burkholderiales bacterium]|nr:PAS domain-containing protein [Burkholderiales bacterium]